jgi:hypothetical protein
MMKSPRLAAALIALAAAPLVAFEWPLESPTLVSTFGTPADRAYSVGIVVSSGDETVKAVDSGDVVFSSEGDEGPLMGLGAWIALSHERDLMSVYAGLRPSAVPAYLKVAGGRAVLGLAGSDGGKGFRMRFMLFDREKGRWVNPLLFLDPVKDLKVPVIRSAYLKRDALPMDLSQVRAVRQGISELIADFGDPGPSAAAEAGNAPFQIQVILNGTERLNLLWDTAREKAGRLLFFSGEGVALEDFLAPDGKYRIGLIPVVRGRTTLEIIVSDYARNSRTSTYSFQAE